MGIESLIGAGASLIGGAIGSDAAEDAANSQVEASREATKAQREMFERQVELQQPFRDFGGAGVNRLAYELGLSPTGFYGPGGRALSAPMETEAQIRARLRPQFQASGGVNAPQTMEGFLHSTFGNMMPAPAAAAGGAGDEAAYEAAVQAELARMQQAQAGNTAATANALTDPSYGNLLRDFAKSDFETDPGYAFRQEEGEKAMQRAAAASGGLGSGKFLKDAMRFNQGIATEEYGKSFDRFNINKTNRFNRLASVAGIGQASANQTGAAASNFGSQIGSNIIGAGNAAAAGRVGSANAISGGIGQGLSMYNNNRLMDNVFKKPTGWAPPIVGGVDYSQFGPLGF